MAQEWWRSAVIYQIYPRSFQDDTGDGVGDLKGITRRLDHVASLGVDAIWLSPFFTSPMADMGYDVADYCDVDPIFGTLADFDQLVSKAHDLGLKVIIDQVLSHTSDQHPWFKESRTDKSNPKADWYVWADPNPDGTPPNNWPSVFGGPAWEWEPRRRQYYLHNFLIEQPDLNLHNPEVQDALLDAMRFWLERGVDGFRLDTANFYFHDPKLRSNPPADHPDGLPVNTYAMQEHLYSKNQPENIAFLKRMRALTDEYPDRTMVGEIGENHRPIEIMAEYTKGGDRLHMAYSFEMLSAKFSPEHFRSKISTFFDGAPDGWPCWSFSNHDVARHVSRWQDHGADQDDLAKQAAALLFSFEGTVGIYQGEELGQTETTLVYEELTDPPALRFWPEEKGRDGCRTPMVWEADAPEAGFSGARPWLPVKAEQSQRAVDQQATQNDSVLNFYRSATAFRKANPALQMGKTEFLDTPAPILAFYRRAEGQAMLCVFNLSPESAQIDLSVDGELMDHSRGVRHEDEQITLDPNAFGFFQLA